jgi:hypothetical protein
MSSLKAAPTRQTPARANGVRSATAFLAQRRRTGFEPKKTGPANAGPATRAISRADQGATRLSRVDQLASAVRLPVPPGLPAQVPSRLSPLPPAKKGPPQLR